MSTTIVHDTALVFGRELKPVLRDPFSVLFGLIQPRYVATLIEETNL